MAAKAKLYGIRPDLVGESGGRSKKKKGKNRPTTNPSNLSPGVNKLLQKLAKIEGDPLFDMERAESRWLEQHNVLAKAQAQRRRLKDPAPGTPKSAPDSNKTTNTPTTTTPAETDVEKIGSSGDEQADVIAVTDLFKAWPDEEGDPKEEWIEQQVDFPVDIVNFGDAKGLDPRRLLEDVCKARYVIHSAGNRRSSTLLTPLTEIRTQRSHTSHCSKRTTQTAIR